MMPYYTPLSAPSAIRILVLRPGLTNSQLVCSFSEHRLKRDSPFNLENHELPYVAISYTWHEKPEQGPDFSETIYCNEQPVSISKNLFNLLKRLRDPENKRRIWVDQLCIDQGNAIEKAEQIPLMGQIYTQASEVVFWIGEEDAGTAQAFSLAKGLEKALANMVLNDKHTPTPDTILKAEELGDLGLSSLASGEWWPFLSLLSRPVFARLWIVQEVALASHLTLQCGSHGIAFSTFGNAATILTRCRWVDTLQIRYLKYVVENNLPADGYLPLVHHVESLWNRRQHVQSGRADTLENLLFTTRRCATSREWGHDRVFGVLGLVARGFKGGTLPSELQPSYAKTAEEVYADTVIYLLQQRNLSILSAIEDASLRAPACTLPSWVPDFSIFPAVEHLGMHAHILNFCAGGVPISPSISPNKRTFRIRARKLDTITTISSKCPSESESISDLSLATFFEDACKLIDLHQPYLTREDMVEVFWRTLVADNFNSVSPAPEILRRHFVGFCLQSAMYLHCQVYMDQFRLEGERNVSMEMVVDRAWDEARMAKTRDPDEIILGVNDGRFVFPLRPEKIGTYAPGIHTVFSQGIFKQIMDRGAYPKEYLTNSNGAEFRSAMKRWCQNRRVFCTGGKGYLGSGGASIRSGDGVYVLEGAAVPFVLREEAAGLRIVGECYVHGVMRGEVLDDDGNKWEKIRIV